MTGELSDQPEPWTSEEPPKGARPAATLIIVRDMPGGEAPEILMLQRSKGISFGGAIVFPGGRVDEGDHSLAAELDHCLSPADAAARIAAIRETIEEAGIAVGLTGSASPETVQAMRKALHAGSPIGAALGAHGLTIDLEALTPFARWCPPRKKREDIPHVFDTRFYVSRAPEGEQIATADATEHTRLRWDSAARIMADCDEGRELAVFPTRCNLERLALAPSYEAVVDHALAYPVEMATTWVEMRGGEPHICIPDHLGYPIPVRPRSGIRRA